jgi:hypothetical protein
MLRRGALVLVCALAACQDPPAISAEDAYLRVLKACDKNDAARLFDAFDTPTQWSIETVQKEQREMKRRITASYPDPDRERSLSRLPAATEEDEEHPRRYYRRLDGSAEILAGICKRMNAGSGQPVGSIRDSDGTADVWRTGGSVFHFARDKEGRWGLAEFRDEWEQAKVRATHDAETVRQNEQLYQKRATATKGN